MVNIWWSDLVSDLRIRPTGEASSTVVTGEIREFSVSGGDRDVEQIKTFGANEFGHEKSMEMWEISLTLLHTDVDFASLHSGGTDSSFFAVGAMPHAITGDSTRSQAHIQLLLRTDATATRELRRLTYKSAYGVTRELSLNTDDFFEETINFKCLSSNSVEEYTDDASTSALPTANYINNL